MLKNKKVQRDAVGKGRHAMELKVWHVFLVFLIVPLVSCLSAGGASQEIQECLQHKGNGTDYMKLAASVHAVCLREFLTKAENVQWGDYNVTQKDKNFINFLFHSIIQGQPAGSKTHIPGGFFPKTGFRIRREIRRLSDEERKTYYDVINKMKAAGQYDLFANLHRDKVIDLAHGGPTFFGWHRIFLSLVEEAMRMINPTVAIPYWDSTMDFDMTDPKKSIIWSPEFFGNNAGLVVTGPFAHWMTPFGLLKRTIGKIGGRPISKQDVAGITKVCHTREMSNPTAKDESNLDLVHGHPHMWVGGQMYDLNSVVHDPLFFSHHGFIDYIWELFREHQAKVCGVNPATDYPNTVEDEGINMDMVGLTQYKNIDGYSTVWTKFWYKYEKSPTCSEVLPSCGSPYLWCDVKRGRCISIEAPSAENLGVDVPENIRIPENSLSEILMQDEWFG